MSSGTLFVFCFSMNRPIMLLLELKFGAMLIHYYSPVSFTFYALWNKQ